jgi:hypothetical protein
MERASRKGPLGRQDLGLPCLAWIVLYYAIAEMSVFGCLPPRWHSRRCAQDDLFDMQKGSPELLQMRMTLGEKNPELAGGWGSEKRR